ncbi:MAG TPA: TIM barrel protein, partial [Pirellulaceae bacterium]|nr:TIM barrel protein [Pirellulaceae bacterium]
MVKPLDRRRFLQTCSIASAAAATGFAANESYAAEPLVRNGVPKFKFSLAAYSYRKLLQGKTAELTVADFIDDCAKMQLEGTELTSYYFPNPTTPEYLRELKQQCFRLGLDISGTAVGNDFGLPPGEKRDEQIAHLKHWIDNAEILGAPVIRVFAGHVNKETTAEQSHKLMVEGLEECCEYAG